MEEGPGSFPGEVQNYSCELNTILDLQAHELDLRLPGS